MALPPALPHVEVHVGPLVDYAGNVLTGTVTIKASVSVTHIASGTPILATPVTLELDETGEATFYLPATDATGLTSTAFTYQASYALRNARKQVVKIDPFNFALPQAAPSVDLDALIPMQSSVGQTVAVPAVISVAGLSGAVSGAALGNALLPYLGNIGGGGLAPTAPKTTAYQAVVRELVLADATAGSVTVAAPVGAVNGDTFAVIKTDSSANPVVVTAAGSTINGDADATIVAAYAGGTFIKTSAGWLILSVMPGSTGTAPAVTGITGGTSGSTYTLADISGGNASSTYTLAGYSGGTA